MEILCSDKTGTLTQNKCAACWPPRQSLRFPPQLECGVALRASRVP